MSDLSFAITGAEVSPFAAVPTLIFTLRIENAIPDERIAMVTLRSQIQIAASHRHYTPEAQARLVEVFGEPQRWRETLRPLLWTNVGTVVPQFTGSTTAGLPVPCTYDFEVVATKYFDALNDGEIPLTFLFSGTVFYEGVTGRLQAGQISWEKEAAFRLPVSLWREMIAHYFPNSGWIRLHKDVLDQLNAYKAAQSIPTWEAVFMRLLEDCKVEVGS